MKLIDSISSALKLLAERGRAAAASRTNRCLVLETLETRRVLSGDGIPPMMEHPGDFPHGGERGGHEMHGPGPDFGGRDGGREMPPRDFGEFGLPMQRGPERDFGGFAPPPPQPMFPPTSDLPEEGNKAIASSQLPLRPSAGSREPSNSGATAGMTNVVVVSEATPTKAKELKFAVSAVTVESQSQNAKSVESSRDNTAAPKPHAKDSPAVKVPKDDLDGLIELTVNETSQRTRRKSAQAATAPTQTAVDKLERLTTLSLGSRDDVRRLPQTEAASRQVFAAWPASGPAWVPADAGLVEILADDIVSHARQISATTNVPSPRRGTSPVGLKAEINLYQAFDLAPEPADATAAAITADATNVTATLQQTLPERTQ